jgi:hypothetical protein
MRGLFCDEGQVGDPVPFYGTDIARRAEGARFAELVNVRAVETVVNGRAILIGIIDVFGDLPHAQKGNGGEEIADGARVRDAGIVADEVVSGGGQRGAIAVQTGANPRFVQTAGEDGVADSGGTAKIGRGVG